MLSLFEPLKPLKILFYIDSYMTIELKSISLPLKEVHANLYNAMHFCLTAITIAAMVAA